MRLPAPAVSHRRPARAASRPDLAPALERQLERLVAPDQMGTLFKALAITAPEGFIAPGFEEA